MSESSARKSKEEEQSNSCLPCLTYIFSSESRSDNTEFYEFFSSFKSLEKEILASHFPFSWSTFPGMNTKHPNVTDINNVLPTELTYSLKLVDISATFPRVETIVSMLHHDYIVYGSCAIAPNRHGNFAKDDLTICLRELLAESKRSICFLSIYILRLIRIFQIFRIQYTSWHTECDIASNPSNHSDGSSGPNTRGYKFAAIHVEMNLLLSELVMLTEQK